MPSTFKTLILALLITFSFLAVSKVAYSQNCTPPSYLGNPYEPFQDDRTYIDCLMKQSNNFSEQADKLIDQYTKELEKLVNKPRPQQRLKVPQNNNTPSSTVVKRQTPSFKEQVDRVTKDAQRCYAKAEYKYPLDRDLQDMEEKYCMRNLGYDW